MKLTGSHQFDAPAEEIYERLLDPEQLRRCMPGCERLEQVDVNRFELDFSVPVPAITGSFKGTVEVVEPNPPTSFRMKINATGNSGFVNADARMRIDPDGDRSTVLYDADAEVGGRAASVGQRVLTGISRRQVEQMMRCLDRGRPGLFVRAIEWIRSRLGRSASAR
jgi:uncharacterized protein